MFTSKSAYFMLLFLEIVALKIAHLKNAFLLTNTESLNHSILDCSKKYNFYEMKIPDDLKDQLTEYRIFQYCKKTVYFI